MRCVERLVAFVAIAALVIVTPGPDTALTIRNSLVRGRRGGFRTAAGVASGQAVWAVCTAAGVAAALRSSHDVFVALRFAGAAYLVYLGARGLVARRDGGVQSLRAPVALRAPYLQGLVSNLANPKMLVFFLGLLPQFGRSFAAAAGLGAIFCAMTFGWLSVYAVAVSRLEALFRRSRVRRALDRLTGAVLVALGVRLATEHA